MSSSSHKPDFLGMLWDRNPALVGLLGLCPLIGVTHSTISSLSLGLITIIVMVLTSYVASETRSISFGGARVTIIIIVSAASITLIDLLMAAYAYQLRQVLGIFLPLVSVNSLVLARATIFASKNPAHYSVLDALIMGSSFTFILVLLGTIRELLGTGALFADMHLLFGAKAHAWHLEMPFRENPLILASMPAGAFLLTGILIAVKNKVDSKSQMQTGRKDDR